MSKYPYDQETCPSVIFLLMTEIIIKMQSHLGVISSLTVKCNQSNQKLHSVRGLPKLNGKLNYTSLYWFYKYSSFQNIFGMLSYLYWHEYNVEILWEMFPFKKYAAQTQLTIILISVVFSLVWKCKNRFFYPTCKLKNIIRSSSAKVCCCFFLFIFLLNIFIFL